MMRYLINKNRTPGSTEKNDLKEHKIEVEETESIQESYGNLISNYFLLE